MESFIHSLKVVETRWLSKAYRWDGLKTIIKVNAHTEDKASGAETRETREDIRSLSSDARQALHAVRSHWQVESMHWIMDMTFREDASRIRKGHGALAFNVLRKIELNLFRQNTTRAAAWYVRKVVRKKKRAARGDDDRSVLLESAINMPQPWLLMRQNPSKCCFAAI